jgi:hypothetical protein
VFVVDTNVLVYAANRDAPNHPAYRQRLEDWRRQATPWYLTWSVIYEFLRVITHRHVLRSPWNVTSAWNFIEAMLASPSAEVLSETDRHSAVLADLLREVPNIKGNLLHDAHVAAVMREHGIRQIVTLDEDFRRFPLLEVINPLE